MPSPLSLRPILAEIGALLLAATCAGCGLRGALLCDDCRDRLCPHPRRARTPSGIVVHAALPYAGVPARCIRRVKGDGETLLARPLGAALASVLDECPDLPVVPVPTSRASFRRRGYRVPDLLIERAGRVPWRVLRQAGARADQRGLDVQQRAANVRGSMVATTTGRGASVILVDDVVTTGATIDEAARALAAAGFEVAAAVALAATERHSRNTEDSSATRRK